MKQKNSNYYQHGQTLITLLVFTVVAITVTSAAIILGMANAEASSNIEQGIVAHHIAESGAENAVLRVLRNPNYTGETLTVGDGQAIITVTGTVNQKTIRSEGRLGDFTRVTEVQLQNTNNAMTITSWHEIF